MQLGPCVSHRTLWCILARPCAALPRCIHPCALSAQELDILLASLEDILLERSRGGDSFAGNRLQVAEMALNSGLFADGAPDPLAIRTELKEAMSRQEAKLAGNGEPKPQEGTVRWYYEHKKEPVSKAGSMTIWQYCYAVVWQKQFSSMRNKAVEFLCKWLSSAGLLPEDNHAPRCACRHGVVPGFSDTSIAAFSGNV